MAYPQYIQMSQVGIHLAIEWVNVVTTPHALLIDIANDGELTVNLRRFLVPPTASSVLLDAGPGTWYVRIGAFVGNERGGIVDWSGVYGPCLLFCTTKDVVPPKANTHALVSTQSILGGVRLLTGRIEHNIALLEHSKSSASVAHFATSGIIRTRYIICTNERTYVDCLGLEDHTAYSIRYTYISAFPTGSSIVQLEDGVSVHNQTPARPATIIDSTAHSTHAADVAVLRNIEQVKHPRFASHSDYLRYMASRARTMNT